MAAEKRSSYVRVAREVEPTPHVNNFLRRLDAYALEILPDWSHTGRRLARTLEEQKQEGLNPRIKEVRIPAIDRRDVDNLRVGLYEDRQPATKDGNFKLLRRLSGLVELDFKHLTNGTSAERLTVTSGYIIESTSRAHFSSRTRWEFSLVIDDGPELRQLHDEARAARRAAGISQNRGGLRVVTDAEEAMLEEAELVPIFTVERWAGKRAVHELVECVNLGGIGAPLVQMNLLPPELDSKIRPA